MTTDALPGTAARIPALLGMFALANFAIGMGAFVVVGMLSPVAAANGVDTATAGLLMSVYAVVYAVTSPLLVAAAGRLDRRAVLAAGLLVFAAGSALAAAAPGFEALLAARAVMALGAGLVSPVAASVAVAISVPERRGKALAIVFGGLTLAQVFGVPVGAWLAYPVGWRWAFAAVAGLSGLAAIAAMAMVPRGIEAPVTRLSTLLSVISTPRLMLAVAFTALLMSSTYVVYTYMAPLLEARHGLGRDGVTTMFLLIGIAAVLGNVAGGLATDRIGPRATLLAIGLAQLVLMPAITLVPLPLPATAALIFVWTISTWAFMVPQQARLAALDQARTPVLFALNAACIYIGASLGSAAGGQVLRSAGLALLGPAGAAIALAAVASLLALRER
jgi:DHA1 family inner membrane transport protein